MWILFLFVYAVLPNGDVDYGTTTAVESAVFGNFTSCADAGYELAPVESNRTFSCVKQKVKSRP